MEREDVPKEKGAVIEIEKDVHLVHVFFYVDFWRTVDILCRIVDMLL
ncbi:hypothetical protein EMIT079MI2_140104 [Bacillus sp. IT-79MI2]